MYNIDFFSKSSFTKKSCAFFPVVVFIWNTHTRPKTHTAGRKETIKSLFSSSPPVFATIFTQKMHNPCIQLRLIGNESHWEQFKMWQMCLPATQRILVNNKTGSDPLKCPELMPFRWESASQSRHLHEKMLHTDCYIFFFHFYLCKTLSWKHLWVLCTGSLQEVREMAVECNCVDCLLITSFRLKRSPVQKNLGDLLDINKH